METTTPTTLNSDSPHNEIGYKVKHLWNIDKSHSEIEFKVKHLMISNVKGSFKEFGGVVYAKGDDFSNAEVDFWLLVSSIDTRDTKRDKHLKSADFFDIEHYEKIIFKASYLTKIDNNGSYKLHGLLTIKKITKDITLDVVFNGLMKDPWGNNRAGFSVKGIINRKDWGLNWNTVLETGGLLVSEEVTINCDIELIK